MSTLRYIKPPIRCKFNGVKGVSRCWKHCILTWGFDGRGKEKAGGGLDAVAFIQFNACRAGAETLYPFKRFTVFAVALSFRTHCDNNIGPDCIEDLTDIFLVPRQTVETVTAVSTFQNFFADFVFFFRHIGTREAGEP
jgi:hypothetical protein